jgi:hypothetical protein
METTLRILVKGEGDTIPEGASITPSSQAHYFYFRRGEQIINIRMSRFDEPIEIRQFSLNDHDFLA